MIALAFQMPDKRTIAPGAIERVRGESGGNEDKEGDYNFAEQT
ncbi:MAG: hypothetical protein JWO80_4669 [Bryobacterales bacterium]|nr:hypothetical protein [Bryobacterales bacterium]